MAIEMSKDGSGTVNVVHEVLREEPEVVVAYLLPSNKMSMRSFSERRPTLGVVVKESLPNEDYPQVKSRIAFDLASSDSEQELDVLVLNRMPAKNIAK